MAADDLDKLRQELPDLFENLPLPPDWDEDWIFIPDWPEFEELETRAPVAQSLPTLPEFGGAEFPGAPSPGYAGDVYAGDIIPPPDALAFYLPFHFFHPHWWGIYVTVEGVNCLADFVNKFTGGDVSLGDSIKVARSFVYGHEAFHHKVESYAARLEITHRKPLYRTGFYPLFREVLGTDDCLEEGLASAHGYERVRGKRFHGACQALQEYMKSSPPGYRIADRYIHSPASFNAGRSEWAELNHRRALPAIPALDTSVWASFPHAFSGIGRVTSKVNYIVHRDSPLAKWQRLGERYLTYRGLEKRLRKLLGCKRLRGGKGSHERWQAPDGSRFTVPRHPGDLRKGTLAQIVRDAGWKSHISEFLRERV